MLKLFIEPLRFGSRRRRGKPTATPSVSGTANAAPGGASRSATGTKTPPVDSDDGDPGENKDVPRAKKQPPTATEQAQRPALALASVAVGESGAAAASNVGVAVAGPQGCAATSTVGAVCVGPTGAAATSNSANSCHVAITPASAPRAAVEHASGRSQAPGKETGSNA